MPRPARPGARRDARRMEIEVSRAPEGATQDAGEGDS